VASPWFWACAVGLLAGWPLVAGLLRRPAAPPPILGPLPTFTLEGSSAERVDNAALAGRVWLVGFLDAGCTACGVRLGHALERLQYRLRNVGPAVGMLEVGLSAATPIGFLEQERSRRHANPRQWQIATGPDATRLLAGVGALAANRAPILEAGSALVLVDAQGRVRAVQSVEAEAEVDQLLSQLTMLLNR
jgi:hypothetical protein